MEFLPYYDSRTSSVLDGYIFRKYNWCENHFKYECKKFYSSLEEEGYHICPYGFTVYVKKIGQFKRIYSSVLVLNHYERKKTSPKIHQIKDMPLVWTEDKFVDIVKKSIDYDDDTSKVEEILKLQEIETNNLRDNNENFKKYVSDTLHEIRGFNAILTDASEETLNTIVQYIGKNPNDFYLNSIQRIRATSGLISSRLSSLDLLINSDVIEKSIRKKSSIHKKFFKCKQVLGVMSKKNNVTINLTGESYSLAEINDLFDICPYLLLDNYIKYSPKDSNINLIITEDDKNIYVVLKNYGPEHTKEELNRVFDMHYRAPCVTNKNGSGIGLYIVRKIFDYLNFKIDVQSGKGEKINGVPYAEFITNIEIPISEKKYNDD